MKTNDNTETEKLLQEHEALSIKEKADGLEVAPFTAGEAERMLTAASIEIFSVGWTPTVAPGGMLALRAHVLNSTAREVWPLGVTAFVGPANIALTPQEMIVLRDPKWPIRTSDFFGAKAGERVTVALGFIVDAGMLRGGYMINFMLWDQRGNWRTPARVLDRMSVPLRIS